MEEENKETKEETDDTTDEKPIEKVNKSYEELKEANDKIDAELLRGEELRARVALGGKSEAGQEEIKEDPAQKMADEISGAFI